MQANGMRLLRRAITALALAIPLFGAGGATADAAQCPAQPYPEAGHVDAPNLGSLKLRLVNYGCFGDYARDLAQAVAAAREYVAVRAGEIARPALVLDIDETALSNWRLMLANDFGYVAAGPCAINRGGPCSQRAWELMAKAEPIAPTLELFKEARARGIAVFFITGRGDDPAKRAATARNLRRAGYHGWSALIMRAPDELHLTATEYKSRRRAAIESQGYTIIASIGDQWSDLDGGHVERTFKLPNPFYFIR